MSDSFDEQWEGVARGWRGEAVHFATLEQRVEPTLKSGEHIDSPVKRIELQAIR